MKRLTYTALAALIAFGAASAPLTSMAAGNGGWTQYDNSYRGGNRDNDRGPDRDRDGIPDRYERRGYDRGHYRDNERGYDRGYYRNASSPRRDEDRDGIPNRYDRDRDGDGVPNRYDRRPDNAWRR